MHKPNEKGKSELPLMVTTDNARERQRGSQLFREPARNEGVDDRVVCSFLLLHDLANVNLKSGIKRPYPTRFSSFTNQL
jgi:hypothetical protein